MATANRSSVDLTTTSATQVGQAGISGGAYTITAVNYSASAATITIAVNAVTATIANAGTLVYQYSLPATGEPLILTGVVLAASEYVNAQAGTGSAIAVTMSGYDK